MKRAEEEKQTKDTRILIKNTNIEFLHHSEDEQYREKIVQIFI